jgi:SHS2 domain-containing protein
MLSFRIMAPELPPHGVTFLDHTADVGLRARASTPESLFRRAAAGTLALVEGEEEPDGVRVREARPDAPRAEAPRVVVLEADDLPTLLRAWLREVLWWHEVEGLALRRVRFRVLEPVRLEAEVTLAPPPGPPVREIKGVTLHGLEVAEEAGEWRAQVIFDV